jgi:hypothetical protein
MHPMILRLSICTVFAVLMTLCLMPVSSPFPTMHVDYNRMFVR